MDLETLQIEYAKLQDTLKQTSTELKEFKENYSSITEEKQKLSDEISRLKTVNFDLFERVNAQYVKDSNQVETQSTQISEEPKTKTLDQITQELM